MYYELYVDTLFLLHFYLNLCMLTFTNYLLSSVARKKRILQGAVLGAGCVVGVVLIPVFIPVRLLGGLVLSIIIMGKFTFGVTGVGEWKEVLEKLSLSTLLLGSMILIILRIIPVDYSIPLISISTRGRSLSYNTRLPSWPATISLLSSSMIRAAVNISHVHSIKLHKSTRLCVCI